MELSMNQLGKDGKPVFIGKCEKCKKFFYTKMAWARHLKRHPQ